MRTWVQDQSDSTFSNFFSLEIARPIEAKLFSGTKCPMTLKVGMQHLVLEYYQVCSNDDTGLTLTILRQGKIWSLVLLYKKKVKQSIFQKLL